VETYGALRALADSWALLAMVVFFAGVVLWVFRPGARRKQDEAARSIFENEDKPKDEPDGR
jgi:cytochrome c oxidase cbb3-type subunit IV